MISINVFGVFTVNKIELEKEYNIVTHEDMTKYLFETAKLGW